MTKKVIIIDDSLTSLNLIKMKFASCDWGVYGAQNANDALQMIYDIAPDLIVTDAIMPIMGGFQFLKIIRNDKKISDIPVIVYSILEETNAKYYIKKEFGEYYLKKSDNLDILINLANNVTEKHPVSEEYKYEILKTNIGVNIEQNTLSKSENNFDETLIKPPLDFKTFEAKFKEKYDFTRSDEKIISEVFQILYEELKYTLSVICIDSYEKNEKTVYFDIKDIILSPIFQDSIMQNLHAKKSFLFKKYTPNLKVITNEDEFLTKIKYDFEYKEQTIANVIFYSKEKSKWINDSDIEIIKKVLEDFFKARYINTSSKSHKINDISNKYFIDKFDLKINSQNKKEMYVAIVEIANLKELNEQYSQEELDIIHSKISEKLINIINTDEQVYKNEENDYVLAFYAKDRNQAKEKLEWVIEILREINFEENKIDAIIGACNCNINGQFNFYEAQKLAHDMLDNTSSNDRIIIYGTE